MRLHAHRAPSANWRMPSNARLIPVPCFRVILHVGIEQTVHGVKTMRLNPSLKTLGSIVLFIAVKKRIITLSCAFLAISLSGVVIQSQRGGDKEEKGAP